MFKKNIFKYFILILAISFLGVNGVTAARNPYKKGTSWGDLNCTWAAWRYVYEYTGVALPGWGNAKEWDDDAKKDGYEVGYEPRGNSIIVWEDWTDYGHVGYVTKVDNEKIYVMASTECRTKPTKEMEDAYNKCWEEIYTSDPNSNQETDRYAHEQCVHLIKTEQIPCEYEITDEKEKGTKFVYLDNAPKKPTKTNTTTVKKSNNANLSTLTISDVDLEFNKKTLKYEVQVKGNVEKVNVSAKAENVKAKVTGAGDYDLTLGNNTIIIGVMAEDGTKKTYTIEIKRLDNNALLNNITISNIDNFNFKKDVFEYNIDVDYVINQIKVDATSESALSKIEGLGNHNLKLGENKIDIKVTAEDNTSKTYSLTINRKDQKQVEEEKQEEVNDNKSNSVYYILGGPLLAAIVISIVIFIKKHKKEKNITKNLK